MTVTPPVDATVDLNPSGKSAEPAQTGAAEHVGRSGAPVQTGTPESVQEVVVTMAQDAWVCVLPLLRMTLYPLGVTPPLGALQVIVTGLGPLVVEPLPALARTLTGAFSVPTLACALPLPDVPHQAYAPAALKLSRIGKSMRSFRERVTCLPSRCSRA